VNKIIHDMLFNNNSYREGLSAMASVHGIFSLFAMLTANVVVAIQWILAQMYRQVNRSYLGLSRQMEFHADLVAASVCGSNNIINALRRIELAQVCYSATLNLCNKAWEDKAVVKNFYQEHTTVIKFVASNNQIGMAENLPVINETREGGFTKRVNWKNQWASHPTLQERKEYLDSFNLTADVETAPAWSLFKDEEKWKEELTRRLYIKIPGEEIKKTLTSQEFESLLEQQEKQVSVPAVFREFYNNRQVNPFDVEKEIDEALTVDSLDTVFNDEVAGLPKKIEYLAQDVAILQGIFKKEIDTNSFDFDGQKYPRKKAKEILAILESELGQKQNELNTADKNLFHYIHNIASEDDGMKLKNEWQDYFKKRKDVEDFVARANKMLAHLSPVFKGHQLALENISELVRTLKEDHELNFKNDLKQLNSFHVFDGKFELKDRIERFIQSDYHYFHDGSFFETELLELSNLVHEVWNAILDAQFRQFKNITEFQSEILEKSRQVVEVA